MNGKPNAPEYACLGCGACCAAFRVDFHREDLAAPGKDGVPERMAVRLTPTLYRLRGTDDAPPRCVGLEGEIGRSARCSIYRQRPGPCRDFAPYAPLGMGEDACDRARRRHGLPPLEP
ncbi:MAG: YkgJ family cysteine cluster protein [Candidatus Accumulibacter sp.]|jgi:Fe-S-cluster containining protein|nr:YkgJ family cysteine cluster protein [Accumulibacter sp.]